jgi:hypothetical protein
MTREESSRDIVTTRFLILQSKRLMLTLVQRRLDESGLDSLRRRVEILRAETDIAQHAYQATMLEYGSPDQIEYWTIAYGRLIEMGSMLANRLRDAVIDLPLSERYQASADVEMLEDIVEHWQESMRSAMAKSVA